MFDVPSIYVYCIHRDRFYDFYSDNDIIGLNTSMIIKVLKNICSFFIWHEYTYIHISCANNSEMPQLHTHSFIQIHYA